MNIFVVNNDPKIAARQLCDKHVVKMILESAQMLCSAFENGEAPYKRSYYNHPCTKWVRESQANYEWLLTHAYGLCEEYFLRYGKIHKLGLDQELGLTPFAQAMPDEYKNDDVVQAYRNYYNGEKAYFAKWKSQLVPDWFGV
jgi:hypothetical protein